MMPSAEGRQGTVFWVGPEEDHKNDQEAGALLLWRKAETVGVAQPGGSSGKTLLCPFNI